MKNNFTLADYSLLLKYFNKTHRYITFREYKKEDDHIILLRHDIDYSLKHALKMAKLESDLGIKATYFILFSSLFYNLFDEENIQIVRQIKNLGHEIGLHYDVRITEKGNPQNPIELLNAQAKILGQFSDDTIKSIAMHNPSISGTDLFRESNYVNVYDDKFVKEMGYFSDSCMAWRDNFIEHLKLNNFPSKIQLGIHPILYSEAELTRWEKLDGFILSKVQDMEAIGVFANEQWKKHSGVIEHDARRN